MSLTLEEHIADPAHNDKQNQEGGGRHTRNNGKTQHDDSSNHECFGLSEQLSANIATDIGRHTIGTGHSRHNHAGTNRDKQSRDL